MDDRRTVLVAARVTPSEAHRLEGEGGGGRISLRAAAGRDGADADLDRAALAAERERTRQVARIGNNLNQLARWANTHKTAAEAAPPGWQRTFDPLRDAFNHEHGAPKLRP